MGKSFTLKASRGTDFKEYSIDQQVTSIGRSADNAIVLDDAQISRHHAEVQFNEGVARITDLGSSNGTLVNGKNIEPNVPYELKEGDSIGIGGYMLSVDSLPVAPGAVASPAEEKPVAAASTKAKPPVKKPKRLGGKALAGIIAATVLVAAVVAAVLFVPGGLRNVIDKDAAHDLLEKPGQVIDDLDLYVDLDKIIGDINPLNEPPTINSFDASPSNIDPGNFSVLEWSVSGANEISIDHGIGGVNQTGSAEVSPGTTETYTITASNNAGSVTREITITVTGSSSPPGSTPSGSEPSGLTDWDSAASDSPASAPDIESFTASPASINEGNSTTLYFNCNQ
ncbi:MAG: FHA domain-containing protein [Dehalococcoidia bacterium]